MKNCWYKASKLCEASLFIDLSIEMLLFLALVFISLYHLFILHNENTSILYYYFSIIKNYTSILKAFLHYLVFPIKIRSKYHFVGFSNSPNASQSEFFCVLAQN